TVERDRDDAEGTFAALTGGERLAGLAPLARELLDEGGLPGAGLVLEDDREAPAAVGDGREIGCVDQIGAHDVVGPLLRLVAALLESSPSYSRLERRSWRAPKSPRAPTLRRER